MSVHCSEMFRPFEPGQQVLVDLSGAQREDVEFLLIALGDKRGRWKFLLHYPEAAIRVQVRVRSSPSRPADIVSWDRHIDEYKFDPAYSHFPVVCLRDFCFEDAPLAQSDMDLSALL